MLKNYQNLFQLDFNRFNNKIKILIFFKNESDINELKKKSFNLFQCDYRAINSILNLLIKQKCVKKILLNISLITFSLTFIM